MKDNPKITYIHPPVYFHSPSGRMCSNAKELAKVTLAWNKRFKGKTSAEIEEEINKELEILEAKLQKTKHEREYDIRIEKRRLAKIKLRDDVASIQYKRTIWVKKREEKINSDLREQIRIIEGDEAQIRMCKLRIKIVRASLRNLQKDARAQFKISNPFLEQKKLNSLRAKFYNS